MQTGDLVAGDMSQRVDGFLKDLTEVEGPAYCLCYRPQDLEVAHGRRRSHRGARTEPGHSHPALIVPTGPKRGPRMCPPRSLRTDPRRRPYAGSVCMDGLPGKYLASLMPRRPAAGGHEGLEFTRHR